MIWPQWGGADFFNIPPDQRGNFVFNFESGEFSIGQFPLSEISNPDGGDPIPITFETLSGPGSEVAVVGILYDIMDTRADEKLVSNTEDLQWVDQIFSNSTDPLSLPETSGDPNGMSRIVNVLKHRSTQYSSASRTIREFYPRWIEAFDGAYKDELAVIQ